MSSAESEMMRLLDVVTKLTKEKAELVEYLKQRYLNLYFDFYARKINIDEYKLLTAEISSIKDFIAKQGGE